MEKTIRKISTISLVLTVTWLIFTIISMSQVLPSWTDFDYIIWASQPDIFYLVNYINVTLLTFMVIALFTVLFIHILEINKIMAFLGIVFIPIYGIMNIICYSIQINIVPLIAKKALNTSDGLLFVSQLIQANSNSIIGFINGLAYSILGITSFIYGYVLIKNFKKGSGLSLIINGILCIIGIIGYILKNEIISMGIILGGISFLVGLMFMVLDFRKKS